jgi:hypothetical protein
MMTTREEGFVLLSWCLAANPAHAWTSELLNQIPAGYQGLLTNPSYTTTLCTELDRLVVARITQAESAEAVLPPEHPFSREPTTLATLEVLRQVEGVGPMVNQFQMLMPGALGGDGLMTRKTGYAYPRVGAIVVIPANYVRDDYTNPFAYVLTKTIIEIPPDLQLPSNADLTAAYQEVCNAR